MKNISRLTLLLPLLFSLGACSTADEGVSSNQSIINTSVIGDLVENFIYDNSVANQSLNKMMAEDGYTFSFHAEHETLPDNSSASVYYDVILSGKGNRTWATVNQVNKNGEAILSYQALYEEDTKETYVNDGEKWYHVIGEMPYDLSITDLKGLLVVSGQYLPYLVMTGVIKTRTIQIKRECIKYKFVQGSDELTVIVDRKTQILTQLIDIRYDANSVEKNSVEMTSFEESAGEAPSYK